MIGHDHIRESLEATRITQQPVLFLGPASVGKWTLAEHLRRHWGVAVTDIVRVRNLNMETARDIAQLSYMTANDGVRMILVRLDGASLDAMNVLLKTLEETCWVNRFILVSSVQPPDTILSRCAVYQFGLLTTDEVKAVLVGRHFNPFEAEKLAKASGGQVRNALALADGIDTKVTVLSAMRCITERDVDGLDSLAVKWTDEHTTTMATLCREAVSGRWALFSDAEAEGLGRNLLLRILAALKPDIRPRLVVRSSLMAVLRSTK